MNIHMKVCHTEPNNLYFEYINLADLYIMLPIERKQQDFVCKNQVERNEPNESDLTKNTNQIMEVNTI